MQLLGIKPYIKCNTKSTAILAREIIKVSKAPLDLALEKTYTKHLALLVSAVLSTMALTVNC